MIPVLGSTVKPDGKFVALNVTALSVAVILYVKGWLWSAVAVFGLVIVGAGGNTFNVTVVMLAPLLPVATSWKTYSSATPGKYVGF